MTLLDVIVLLLIAGICGALGQAITGFSRGGCLVSIALGFVGALLGMWLARQLGLPELFQIQIGTTSFPIIWSIIGSALFVAVIALISRRRT
ncbi:MAG: GlsB/YeaQ/YmgE family stress response membrane protein [Pyrinomonadaceae bacterium]